MLAPSHSQETMIFWIVGNLKESTTAEVVRAFADDFADPPIAPAGVVYEARIEVDLGSTVQWQAIHSLLENAAKELGFERVLNAAPCPIAAEAAERGAEISAQTQPI